MFQKIQALQAQEDDGAGGGAANGDHQQDGGQGKQPDDVVPKTQFIAAVNSANRKAEALEAQLAELRAKLEAVAKPADTAKRYTRAELNAMVDAQQITRDQADAHWEANLREQVESQATRVAQDTITTAQANERVTRDLSQYKALAPEILDTGSDVRRRIEGEFRHLVSLGDDPKLLSTELKAIRAVLGPVENLEKARSGRDVHESHRETGAGGGQRQQTRKSDGALTFDDLTGREKQHYEALIQKGVYRDKSEVNEELKFASPRVRTRYGAAA